MTLFVINPNSSTGVTDGIDRAVAPLRGHGVEIACLTLAEGPPGIESQAQADAVVPHLLALADGLADRATGLVVACFGDPGLASLRERLAVPVFGIMESGMLTAMTLGQRIGVISILPGSVPRHWRAYGAMGIGDRIAGDRALGLGVADLSDERRSLDRMIVIGRRLIEEDGADTLVLGCAGMADRRTALEDTLGLPVVEPCQAATAMALGQILLRKGQT